MSSLLEQMLSGCCWIIFNAQPEEQKHHEIVDVIQDANGHPICLVDKNGVHIPWVSIMQWFPVPKELVCLHD